MKEVMKKNKRFFLIFFIAFIFTVVINCSLANASSVTNTNPIFYGTTGITIKKGSNLDLNSTIYRIFAKDYLGRDITSKIKIINNNVNTNKIGNYKISYSVSDNDFHTSQIEVPVSVTQSSHKIQRTLYTLDSAEHLHNADIYRGDMQDSQMLGIYMEKGETIDINILDNENNVKISGWEATKYTATYPFTLENEKTTTIKAEENGIPMIRTSSIGPKKYMNETNDGYGLYKIDENKKIYFANVFEKNSNDVENLSSIEIPVYDCKSYKVYLNAENGDLKFNDNNLIYQENNNKEFGYAKIYIKNKIPIGNKFSIAVEYMGTNLPAGTNKNTYTALSLNGEWKNQDSEYILPPIKANVDRASPVTIEIDLSKRIS